MEIMQFWAGVSIKNYKPHLSISFYVVY